MDVVVVESPAKAKTINKYLGRNYKVLASFGHVRDLPAKDGSVRPDDDFAMSWAVDTASAKRLTEIAKAMKDADGLILATDPDREGEAISWHVLEVLRQKRALKDKTDQPRRLQRDHQTVGARRDGKSTRDRRTAGRRLSCAPRARLSRRLHAVAGAVAQIARRAFGRPRAVRGVASGLRPRVGDRALHPRGLLADRRNSQHAAQREIRGKADRLRRQEASEARHFLAGAGRRHQGNARRRGLQGAVGRGQAHQAQSRSAFHHVDAAAGGLFAARFRRSAHHAGGAAALRRHRDRRRDGRSDHLYAYRWRADGAGGDLRGPRCDRTRVRRKIPAGKAALLFDQGEERAGSARGDPPDRFLAHARRRCANISMPIRRGSTR